MRRKIKIRPDEAILILLFMLIGIGTIFFGSYMVKQYQFNRASRGFYSENAFGIYAKSPSDEPIDISEAFRRLILSHEDVTVNRYFNISNVKLTTVFHGNSFTPDIIKGRYFTEEDFFCGKKLCVIGKNFSTQTSSDGGDLIIENGREYYVYEGVKYEVIGTIGFDLQSAIINRSVIFNGDAQKTEMTQSGGSAFIVDAPTKRQAEQLKIDMVEMIENCGGEAVLVEIPTPSMSVSDFFNMDLLNLIMVIFGAFAVVLATVPLTLIWAQRRKKAVAVKRLLGYGGGLIAIQMFLRLFALFNIGFLMSFIAYNVIARIWYLGMRSFFSPEMAVAYSGALVFNILIAIVPFVQTMRVEPGDALRRE